MKPVIRLLVLFAFFQINAQSKLDSLLQKGNYLQTIAYLQSLDDTYAQNIQLGKIYDETGNYKEAITYFLKAKDKKHTIQVNQLLAKSFKHYGKRDKAIFYYKEIISKDSLNYKMMYQLAKLYAQTEDYKKARSLFDKLISFDSKNANFLYQKALLETDLYERANLFIKVYQLDSLHTKSMYHLANFFKTIRDADSSRLFMDKALRINRNDTKILPLKINDLYRQKQYKKALDLSMHLDSISKNNLFAKQRIGLCNWKLKDYEKAKKYLKQALNLDREEKSTYYYLGLLSMDLKEYKMAKFHFNMAIIMERPDIDNEHFNLGLIAQIEKKPKDAITHFKKAFNNNRKNYKALFEWAVMTDLYYKDKSIALKHYEDYIDRFPKTNKENTTYVTKRIREIKEALFMNAD